MPTDTFVLTKTLGAMTLASTLNEAEKKNTDTTDHPPVAAGAAFGRPDYRPAGLFGNVSSSGLRANRD